MCTHRQSRHRSYRRSQLQDHEHRPCVRLSSEASCGCRLRRSGDFDGRFAGSQPISEKPPQHCITMHRDIALWKGCHDGHLDGEREAWMLKCASRAGAMMMMMMMMLLEALQYLVGRSVATTD